MHRTPQGRYLQVRSADEPFKAFVPTPLPPRPDVQWTPALRRRYDAALLALGRLDAIADLLPNAALLLYSFVRKEAVLSSMIEGTQSSLADLMLYELDEQPVVPVDDAREVSLYVAALEHGLERVRAGFPLILDDEHLLDPGLTTRNRLGIEARDLDPLGKEIELVVPG